MSSEAPMTRVVFFQVRENSVKLKKIVETAQSHFEKKDRLLILVEDARSEQFVDDLLWKMPETSFLPHSASDHAHAEPIAISKSKINPNGAKIAFNLCPTPLLIEGPFRIIYEFEDLTSPSKKNLSSLRFDAYKKAGYLIEAR